ncbi:hypothetical protein MPSEU_000854500 [Mayamaea pseudoterrestris]|nr:hypothetical protein MPSEU_000854500 [Mayamaea pseudoterrestris]
MATMRSNQRPADPDRQLMIKVKTCQRLLKEADHYKTELASNESRMEEMIASDKDSYDIKMFQQVVDESRMMVPDSSKRLAAAMEDLGEFVTDNESLRGEWMEAANLILAKLDKDKAVDDDVAQTNVDDLAEGAAF